MTPKMETETFDYGLGPRGAADRARATLGDNIARGLVELITNSDTAYERRQEDFNRRRIAIEYSSKERWIAVRDQAGGMSREIARQKFKQGGEASEPGGRGYFGVGAKDCAVFGKLTVETVDDSGTFTRIDIPRDYKRNDRAVVRQDRHPQNGGLETDHPYYEAITKAIRPHVAAALEAINAQLQESERAGISANLQQANLAAGSWLGNYLEEDAGGMPSLPDGFYFLPSSVRMGPGTVKRLTLYNIGSDVCVGAPTVTSDANDLVAINEVANFSDPVLPPGATSPRQRARIVVTAGHQIGSATLVAEYAQGDREALLVDADIRIVEDAPPATTFGFEHSVYTIHPGEARNIRVIVPFDLADDNLMEPVRFRVEVEDKSITAIGSGVLAVTDGTEDSVKEAYIVTFRIEARGGAGTAGRIYARFADHETSAGVRSQGTAITVYDDDSETSPPDSRAVVYERGLCPAPPDHQGGPCLHFFLRHRDVQQWLGEPKITESGDLQWDMLDTHGFRAMKADAIADAAAQYRVLRLNQVREASTGEPITADEVLRLLWQEKRRALPQMQRIFIDTLPYPWSSQAH